MIAMPPVELMYDGPAEDFVSNGQEYFQYYKEIADLQPYERMLDVGSGLGRKTIPLVGYLTTGSYEGIDCKELGIKWCQENITPVACNFKFQHVNVKAAGYNVNGSIAPEDFRFPFDDNEFDLVVLNSVFTHMTLESVNHYLEEIHRVLKVRGRCLITWFLLGHACTHPMFPFAMSYKGVEYGRVANAEFPEQAIAYHEVEVSHAYQRANLQRKVIEHGCWSGIQGLSYQDIILATKEN